MSPLFVARGAAIAELIFKSGRRMSFEYRSPVDESTGS